VGGGAGNSVAECINYTHDISMDLFFRIPELLMILDSARLMFVAQTLRGE
jgi:hypothetical protein